MITRVQKSVHSNLDLCFHDTTDGATPKFLLQNMVASSAHYLHFYDVVNAVWSSAPILNSLTALDAVPSVYTATIVMTSLIENSGDTYLVVFRSGSIEEAEIWAFGSTLEVSQELQAATVTRLAHKLLPARVELTRLSNYSLQQSFFDAVSAGTEQIRYTITQNTDGAQPEEVQVDVTSSIGA